MPVLRCQVWQPLMKLFKKFELVTTVVEKYSPVLIFIATDVKKIFTKVVYFLLSMTHLKVVYCPPLQWYFMITILNILIGPWHCHHCLSKIMPTLPQTFTREFGFIQSFKTYTLKQFGSMANKFKRDYFGCPPHVILMLGIYITNWFFISICRKYLPRMLKRSFGE